uniref:Uncharacterized protein n=1 Tax=Onchocerca volvulus TaxID=6282 RepID=A0A8R1XPG7_ONCVO
IVRLVFRPYTKVRRSICTSESLRTSTRVSSGFILLRYSSPSCKFFRIKIPYIIVVFFFFGFITSYFSLFQFKLRNVFKEFISLNRV